MISVSIVSHGHGAMVADLLRDLAALRRSDLQVIVTLNIPESVAGDYAADAGIAVETIRNDGPQGFGANHNQAFKRARGEFFCVLNPDVRLPADPFPALLEAARAREVGLAAPRVQNAEGRVENSARRFPTLASLAAKALGAAPALDYPDTSEVASPDCVGGMFMLLKRSAYEAVGGFDERYFLYYEDFDLCRRLRRKGLEIRLVPSARIVHQARRTSHRNPRYLALHLRSILRFLTTDYR